MRTVLIGGDRDGTVIDPTNAGCAWGGVAESPDECEPQIQVDSVRSQASIYRLATADIDEAVYVFDADATNDLRTCLAMEPAIRVFRSHP